MEDMIPFFYNLIRDQPELLAKADRALQERYGFTITGAEERLFALFAGRILGCGSTRGTQGGVQFKAAGKKLDMGSVAFISSRRTIYRSKRLAR